MKARIAINGFGRIGRTVTRAIFENKRDDIELVAINSRSDNEINAHLLRYDSVHGRFSYPVQVTEKSFIIAGKTIRATSESNPSQIAWRDLDIDIVLECTGVFTSRDKAVAYLQTGAKKVLVSAPSVGADLTVVYGVNNKELTNEHIIVSNASCTTNCLAPVAKILDRHVGIEHGFMTTIHSYTGDQPTLDSAHKDFYRARAAACSIIPTSTGAAKAVSLVLPELAGKLDGVAIRVPTPNVSLIDFTFTAKKSTSVTEINEAMKAAAYGDMKTILAYTEEKLVSSDFVHDPHSAIFHADQTRVMDNKFCRVVAWYDNEWGFSNRMLDVAVAMKNT
ncbi:type I glyceraldehyde-3-phosphate dehydrogenase [Bartonella sp. TP]|uniref:type I glyceraldehyde-3-phosphate dehydrogenase n=1 Tax=Bartonella sp. TP TaxID=3057550 RepID=UPI0025AF6F11|nr:type I glyceraldehyde-3-phosphate dehydrogenase [Bartonella sp. TP]WJW79586.1 type I glyceraldehyde-3-phosphate dehydrogenase [Bartonella sp. TP]